MHQALYLCWYIPTPYHKNLSGYQLYFDCGGLSIGFLQLWKQRLLLFCWCCCYSIFFLPTSSFPSPSFLNFNIGEWVIQLKFSSGIFMLTSKNVHWKIRSLKNLFSENFSFLSSSKMSAIHKWLFSHLATR